MSVCIFFIIISLLNILSCSLPEEFILPNYFYCKNNLGKVYTLSSTPPLFCILLLLRVLLPNPSPSLLYRLNEPVSWHGPFVMNTEEEIKKVIGI